MANKVTRWGIAGAGRISSDFLIGLSCLPTEDHQVVAIGSRSKDRSNELAQKFALKNANTYGSYEEMAADKDIDVVYIGVIHPMHYPLMKLFLNSGHNVVCEKPFTYCLKHSEEVVTLARSKGLFLMEGFWSRFYPAYYDLRRMLADKTIGVPKFVHIHFGNKTTGSGAEWTVNKNLGAGVLLSRGCYCVMFSQLVFNHEMPENITAAAIMDDIKGDVTVNITLQYSNNRVCNILTSRIHDLSNTATVYGDKGDIKIPNFWTPEEIVSPDGPIKHPLPKSQAGVSSYYVRAEGFMYEAQAVRESLLKGLTENPLMTLDQTLQIQTILDEIRRKIGLVYPEQQN